MTSSPSRPVRARRAEGEVQSYVFSDPWSACVELLIVHCSRDPDTVELGWPWGTERGCVVLDQPQHAASSRRLRTSHALRLVFDTAALRSVGAGRGIRGHASSTRCENPCTGSGEKLVTNEPDFSASSLVGLRSKTSLYTYDRPRAGWPAASRAPEFAGPIPRPSSAPRRVATLCSCQDACGPCREARSP